MTQDQIRESMAELDGRENEALRALTQVRKAIAELQSTCRHPNATETKDNVYGTRTCPDCGNVHTWELDGFANMMR